MQSLTSKWKQACFANKLGSYYIYIWVLLQRWSRIGYKAFPHLDADKRISFSGPTEGRGPLVVLLPEMFALQRSTGFCDHEYRLLVLDVTYCHQGFHVERNWWTYSKKAATLFLFATRLLSRDVQNVSFLRPCCTGCTSFQLCQEQ